MSTPSRHRKSGIDLVAKAQLHTHLWDRLGSAEQSLFELEQTHNKKEQPLMFFQLGLRPETLDWISSELGKGIEDRRRRGIDATKTLDRYSRLTVAALVNAGTQTTRDNSFWPIFWEQLGMSESSDLAAHIRRNLHTWMKRLHLDVFDGVNLGSSKYVTQVTLHAGIPTSEMGQLVADSKSLLAVDDDPADGDREGKLLVNKYISEKSPRTLFRLSSLKPELASFLFARTVEYVYYSQIKDDWYTDKNFEGTNGLPAKTFAELRQFLAQQDATVVSRANRARTDAQQQPHLKLDPDAGKILLVLPAVPDEDEDLVWSVDAGFDNFHIEPSIDLYTGCFARKEISISSPTPEISVTDSLSQETTTLPLMAADFPVAFFQADFQYCPNQQELSRNSLFALAPANTEFSDESGQRDDLVAEELQFSSWYDWRVYHLVGLRDCGGLKVSVSDGPNRETRSTSRNVRASGSRDPEWNLDVSKVDEALGSDMGPVYRESPLLKLPHNQHACWAMRISYCPVGGEKSFIEEREDLEEYAGEEIVVFHDEYEDAWVGRYCVEILKDGLICEKQFFNMAEGLRLKMNYQQSVPFRTPDINVAANRYNKAYYEASYTPGKVINIPFTGVKAVGDTEETASFKISSAEGYELDLQVVPKTMRFSIDRTDVPHTWSTFPSAVPMRSLADSGQVKVRFPSRIDGNVTLFVVDGRSKSKAVSLPMQARRNRRLFTVPVHELKQAFGTEVSSFVLAVVWYPLSVQQMWDSEKKLFRGGSRAKKQTSAFLEFKEKYDANALSANLKRSSLFQVSDSPYTGRAVIDGTTIDLLDPVSGRETLRGYVWPLTQANVKPITVCFDSKQKARLPEEFQDAGPLVVEITKEISAYRVQPPKAPSDSALVVAQDGFYANGENDENLLGLSFKLSSLGGATIAQPREQLELWERLSPLCDLSLESPDARTISRQVRGLCERSFVVDPRSSLEALGRSNVRVEHQVGLAIQFGLFSCTFENHADTLDEFHPVPWVGVLGEINDVATIASTVGFSRREGEFAQSADFIESAGGPALISILGGACHTDQEFASKIVEDVALSIVHEDFAATIEGLSDINARRLLTDEVALRHGWAELLRNRSRIDLIPNLRDLKNRALHLSANIGSPELSSYVSSLRSFAEDYGDARTGLWPWAPFISAVMAHSVRSYAHGVAGAHEKFTNPTPWELRPWASLARMCPTLITNDLLREEARQLLEKVGSLPLPQLLPEKLS
ncbi:hypothetical protein [Corynebacterium flavescens]|uniref:hypothetical protein n=1 Tax=Corynebacterium flavescens TaxID=28028 RepID=UPI0026483402|nr:hypothetical protein [Corynebacterium flavescens]MDN6199425.1 hypothetical protein [Corynebacterium flavescens]